MRRRTRTSARSADHKPSEAPTPHRRHKPKQRAAARTTKDPAISIHPSSPGTSLSNLYLLADRLQTIVPRHQDAHATLAGFDPMLELCRTYQDGRDRSIELGADIATAFEHARDQAKALHATQRTWLHYLALRSDHIRAADYKARPSAPGRLLTASQRLLDRLGDLDFSGKQAAQAELSEHIAATRLALDEARALRVEQQDVQRRCRQHALSLWTELVGYRRALSRVLGTTHHDYQLLRTSKGRNASAPGNTQAMVNAADADAGIEANAEAA